MSIITPIFTVIFWILAIIAASFGIAKIYVYFRDKDDHPLDTSYKGYNSFTDEQKKSIDEYVGNDSNGYIRTLEDHKKAYEKNGVYNPPGQHMRVLKDSLKIMGETFNPETFFSRMNLATNEASYCIKEPAVIMDGMTCKDIYEMLSDEDRRYEIVTDFIDKLFDAGKEDNLTYKIHEVSVYMTEDDLEYFVGKLDEKKYHFCKVQVGDTNKLYTYITKDRTIEVGDTVTIPVGNEAEHDYRIRQVEEVFDGPLDDLEFPVKALRCVDKKLKKIT